MKNLKLEELKTKTINGMNGMGVIIRNIICDAPARAFAKGITQFNGRYGCDFCNVKGVYQNGRMMFLYQGEPRTDSSFRQRQNMEHHKRTSLFEQLEIDMINQFPIDPMHAIDLGVPKRLLLLRKEGPLPYRLSANMISTIGDYQNL